ncbi:hypothetical protein, partial [Dactylosporangium siamense]
PTRYLGLAAAAEQGRRSQAADRKSEEFRDALKAATAKVQAVYATRPRPHTDPVGRHLPIHADAGATRTAFTVDNDVQADDDLGL